MVIPAPASPVALQLMLSFSSQNATKGPVMPSLQVSNETAKKMDIKIHARNEFINRSLYRCTSFL